MPAASAAANDAAALVGRGARIRGGSEHRDRGLMSCSTKAAGEHEADATLSKWRGKDPRLDMLAAVDLFSECSRKELGQILSVAKEIDFDGVQDICVEGEPSGRFYLVLEGSVAVKRHGRTLATLTPGDYFGEIALDRRAAPHRDLHRRDCGEHARDRTVQLRAAAQGARGAVAQAAAPPVQSPAVRRGPAHGLVNCDSPVLIIAVAA